MQALLHFLYAAHLFFSPQYVPAGYTKVVTGGTFTLRYTTPWSCTVPSAASTCTASLTGKTVSSGDLLGYQCNLSGGYISTVSNGGTFVRVPAGSASTSGAGAQMNEGYIIAASAESGTETITFNASQGAAACTMWDYSYTGSPAFDGANGFSQAASSTTTVVPTFTPSGGSSNDIYMEQTFTPFTPATSISSPFSIFNISGWASWAHDDNTTSALGPTWTWSGAQSNTMTSQMQFGYNVTAPAQMSFVDFSGTNASNVSLATIVGNTHGPQTGVWNQGGSCTPTYATAASAPLTGSTGRLSDGGTYSDSSTTGIAFATASAPSCAWHWGSNSGSVALSTSTVTAGINFKSDLPATDTSISDSFAIVGTANNDFIIAQPSGNGTNRGIGVECDSLGSQIGFFTLSVSTSYHLELQYNPSSPLTGVTFTNGSASISATNTMVSGQVVSFTTSGGLPTGLSTSTPYYVSATGLSGSAFQVSATNGGGVITMGSAGSGTQKVTTGDHNLYIYSGWASPSSPGTLLTTISCPSLNAPMAQVHFGDANPSTLTSGFFLYFDSLMISLNGTHPL